MEAVSEGMGLLLYEQSTFCILGHTEMQLAFRRCYKNWVTEKKRQKRQKSNANSCFWVSLLVGQVPRSVRHQGDSKRRSNFEVHRREAVRWELFS